LFRAERGERCLKKNWGGKWVTLKASQGSNYKDATEAGAARPCQREKRKQTNKGAIRYHASFWRRKANVKNNNRLLGVEKGQIKEPERGPNPGKDAVRFLIETKKEELWKTAWEHHPGSTGKGPIGGRKGLLGREVLSAIRETAHRRSDISQQNPEGGGILKLAL